MKIKIQMPQGLEDITLREYQKYDRVLNTNVDDKNSERFIQVKMVEILRVTRKTISLYYDINWLLVLSF